MRTSFWFIIAIALGCQLASGMGETQYRLSEQELRQLYSEDIQSLQLMKLPPASKCDKNGEAGALGCNNQGILVTLRDGRQFLIPKLKSGVLNSAIVKGLDFHGSGASAFLYDGRQKGRGWQSVGELFEYRHGYKFRELVRDCRYVLRPASCLLHGAAGRMMRHGRRRSQ